MTPSLPTTSESAVPTGGSPKADPSCTHHPVRSPGMSIPTSNGSRMPASRKAPPPPDLEPDLRAMHCPSCGHTSDCHDGEPHGGCTQCSCAASWVDILIIHIRLVQS